ncbi:hypothetical protein ABZ023_25860 [Streptomyces sp. NPDC006367]|uniref:hypothetical protein n=1 Tax=unclassified Streptomyces TaxID=2593676 RepID=UPI0033B762E5
MLATTSHHPGTRDRLLQQTDRLFADDRGLGVLVEYHGRPDMSKRDEDLQLAWADVLIALHRIIGVGAAAVTTWLATRKAGRRRSA